MDEKGSGWLTLAAVLLFTAGLMRIFDAIWAFRTGGDLPDDAGELLFGHSLTAYGWTWLIVGILLMFAAVSVVSRNTYGRVVGTIAAVVGAVSAIWWMPIYPVWSLVYILLAGVVIYALATYGGRESPTSTLG